MKKIKRVGLLAGSTRILPAGVESLPVMIDGEEPPDMLLALLNNVLPSMINSQQAKIMGQCVIIRPVGTSKTRAETINATIVIFYGVQPTANNLLAVVSATPAESETE